MCVYDENDREKDNYYKKKKRKKNEKMYVTFHNDEAEHIDIDWDKNQHDDLTLHHLIKDIERVISNNTGTITTIDK
jgi:hypothetical protein